ncbi:hypothetical protein [Cerasicoccus maritimus]|uniref:hypothetical protein n=1 Tax=Cerasicoccus maritimus TaxID=490089 RepID=UPI0028525FD2|nr:hypothetical protein [Cerasicoccus maritimus]
MKKQQTKLPASPRRLSNTRKLDDFIARIGDIDTKVEHVIFRLKDSLYAPKQQEDKETEVRK